MKRIRLLTNVAVVVLVALAATAPSQAAPSVADLYRDSYRLEAQSNPGEALSKMDQIRSAAGTSYFVTARTAWLAYLAGRFSRAEAEYHKAIAAAPAAIEPKLGLTLALLAQQKWQELEVASREVLRLDPMNHLARARLAHAFYMRGNYPDSAELYRALMREYPAELDHQTGLGWALAKMGRGAEARRLFQGVLAVSPDNPSARQGMALP
jgi:tetratricopeptide (TPR) repeat protein